MRPIIVLATLAIILPFVISTVTIPLGNAVGNRFLERPTNSHDPKFAIPPETEAGKPLNKDSLAQWATENVDFAAGYARQVIPLDIVYLFCLGVFLAGASMTLARMIAFAVGTIPFWIWWTMPVVYIVFDLSEDALICGLPVWKSTLILTRNVESCRLVTARPASGMSVKCPRCDVAMA